MKLYFERHDGQAVTCDDFAQAIADANPAPTGRLLPQFKRWYSQAGTPRMGAIGHYDADAKQLHADAGPAAARQRPDSLSSCRSSSRWPTG
jgi:aminopeptidase N